jgi:hypothetical protein
VPSLKDDLYTPIRSQQCENLSAASLAQHPFSVAFPLRGNSQRMIGAFRHQSISPTRLPPRQSLRTFHSLDDPLHSMPVAPLAYFPDAIPVTPPEQTSEEPPEQTSEELPEQTSEELPEQTSEEPPPRPNLPPPEFEADAAELFDYFSAGDCKRLTKQLTNHGSNYRLVAKWYRDDGFLDIEDFPTPAELAPGFLGMLSRLIESLFATDPTAITDFLSGLCTASRFWTPFLLNLEFVPGAITKFFSSSSPDLSTNALRLACHFWDYELHTGLSKVESVLEFIASFPRTTKCHTRATISALHVVISSRDFQVEHSSVICDILCDIIVQHRSRRLRIEVIGLCTHMISRGIAGDVIRCHDFFAAFVLQLNVMSEGAQHKFPPEVIAFITDELRMTPPQRQQELLSQLDPELLVALLTCPDAQIREEWISAVTLFILWREEPWAFFCLPCVFAQIATFFITSRCQGKVLWLKFCHALVLTNSVGALALFTEDEAIYAQLYDAYGGSEEEEDPAEDGSCDEDHRETRPFPWCAMYDVYELRWICDHIGLREEPAAYCMDIVLLLLGAAIGNSKEAQYKANFLDRLRGFDDFIDDLSDIVEIGDQTPYALADGAREIILSDHAHLILESLGEALD